HADHGRFVPERLAEPQGGGAQVDDPARPARHPRPARHLRRGRDGIRRRFGGRVPELHVAPGRRVLPYAEGDGARPAEAGRVPEPQATHRGTGAIELRSRPPAGRRSRDSDRAGAQDPGRGDAQQASSVGAGEGRQAPGQDHVPAGLLHLPRRARDRLGSGRVVDRQGPPLDPADRLAAFSPLIPGIRWGTVVVGFVIAALRGPIDGAVGAWGTALVVYAAIRTFFPLRYYEDDPWSLLQLLGELGLTVIAVAATGYWNSPFVFTVISAVMAAGFARGFGFALRLAVACALALTIPYVVNATTSKSRSVRLQDSAQWSAELVLVALVAGYARRLFGEAEVRHSLALDRISRLAEANALLSSLHRVAQSLPSSFDLGEILESTVGRVRELVDCQVIGILLGDGAGTPWTVGGVEG